MPFPSPSNNLNRRHTNGCFSVSEEYWMMCKSNAIICVNKHTSSTLWYWECQLYIMFTLARHELAIGHIWMLNMSFLSNHHISCVIQVFLWGPVSNTGARGCCIVFSLDKIIRVFTVYFHLFALSLLVSWWLSSR